MCADTLVFAEAYTEDVARVLVSSTVSGKVCNTARQIVVIVILLCIPLFCLSQADVGRRRYSSVFDCARQLYRSRGIAGFYAGLTVVCFRAFPVNAVTFLLYTRTLTALNGSHRSSPLSSAVIAQPLQSKNDDDHIGSCRPGPNTASELDNRETGREISEQQQSTTNRPAIIRSDQHRFCSEMT